MGAWGSGTFENDAALDFVRDLVEGGDLDEALALPGPGEYVDVDDGARALAAAEVVAAIHGRPAAGLPDDLVAYVDEGRRKPSKRRTAAALAAVERVQQGNSELADLWRDGSDGGWSKSVEDLRARLSEEPMARAAPSKATRRRRLPLPELRTVLELASPTGAYQFSITEIDSPAGANTQGIVSFASGGSGVFMAMGTALAIAARWTAPDRLEISVPAGLILRGALGEAATRVQHFRDVVHVDYREVSR